MDPKDSYTTLFNWHKKSDFPVTKKENYFWCFLVEDSSELAAFADIDPDECTNLAKPFYVLDGTAPGHNKNKMITDLVVEKIVILRKKSIKLRYNRDCSAFVDTADNVVALNAVIK